jgi:hypothetical protein
VAGYYSATQRHYAAAPLADFLTAAPRLGYFAVCFQLIVLARRLERRLNAAHGEVRL